MMNVVKLYLIHAVEQWEFDVETSVIERGEYTANEDESNDHRRGHRREQASDDETREQVIILAAHKLERMHVDGVDIATWRRLLSVMVFVYVFVEAAQMQCAMKQCVEEIVDDKQRRKECRGEQPVGGTLRHTPTHGVAVPRVAQQVHGEECGGEFVERDEAQIESTQLV